MKYRIIYWKPNKELRVISEDTFLKNKDSSIPLTEPSDNKKNLKMEIKNNSKKYLDYYNSL